MEKKTREELAQLGIFSIALWKKPAFLEKIKDLTPAFIFSDSNSASNDIFVGSGAFINSHIVFKGSGQVFYPETEVGSNSIIGADCILYAGAHILNNVTLGDGCILYEEAHIYEHSTLNPGCILHKKAHVKPHGKLSSKVILGEGSCCDEYAHLYSRVMIHSRVSIGKFAIVGVGTEIMDDCTVGTGAQIGDGLILKSGANIPDWTYVDDKVVRSYYVESDGKRHACYWDSDMGRYLKCHGRDFYDRIAVQDVIEEVIPLREHPLADYVQRKPR